MSWQVSRDPGFRQIVAEGTTRTSAATDHTVKVDVTGLAPYTGNFCRFRALGRTSQVGLTRTAPDIAGEVHALRLALVSCSNYTGGFFTAYRTIAARTDRDFVLAPAHNHATVGKQHLTCRGRGRTRVSRRPDQTLHRRPGARR